jgi:iron complex outermembrane receptor protein
LSLSLLASAILISLSVHASEPDTSATTGETPPDQSAAPAEKATKLSTVTITAERHAEDIQTVPVSASTISDERLDALNASGQDIRSLNAVAPSLAVESDFGRVFPRLYVRGYGNADYHETASQPVSLVYDDVVLENSMLKGFPAFDLEQIEVLRGPQGTLFGRNTPAGVVKFDSVKPGDEFGGYGNISYGRWNTANLEGAVNLPINADWSSRISVNLLHRDNWVNDTYTHRDNQFEGYDDDALRAQLQYKPADGNFSALFNVHMRDLDQTSTLFRGFIIEPGTNHLVPGFRPDEVDQDGENPLKFKNYGGNMRLQWNFGDLTFHSITAYETLHVYSRGDIDGANPTDPIPYTAETADEMKHHQQITQEFRVESDRKQALSWQAGVFYFYENYEIDQLDYVNGDGVRQEQAFNKEQSYFKNNAWAVFGSVRYNVNDDFNLRAGLRYTDDSKNLHTDPNGGWNYLGVTTFGDKASASRVNWDLSADYRLNPDMHLYGRVATGFRAEAIQQAQEFNAYSVAAPETIVSYESGLKTDLFDHRARLNVDAYYWTVKNQQLNAIGGPTNGAFLGNAKKTVGNGVEVDGEALLTDNLKLTFGASRNRTRIEDPNYVVAVCSAPCTVLNREGSVDGTTVAYIDGNALPKAPKYIGNLALRYAIPFRGGELFAFTDWTYRSKMNINLYESVEFTAPPLVQGGLRVGYAWDEGKYEAALFGRNITNQVKIISGLDFNNLLGEINDPRIWGVQFKAKF